jgi:hypothetical protein
MSNSNFSLVNFTQRLIALANASFSNHHDAKQLSTTKARVEVMISIMAHIWVVGILPFKTNVC